MKKLSNYSSIKKLGYTFYILTSGYDKELKDVLLERKVAEFSSEDEAKVFRNTVLYPFDSFLYNKLISLNSNSFSTVIEQLQIEGLDIDQNLIKEKYNEYAVNHFDEFLLEFDIKIDNSVEKDVKK